jgi:type IV fimbrial biogenesis protein FimT
MNRCRSASRYAAGFTLIELMVTVSLMAIMLGIAAPSFIAFQRNADLTATANTFLGTLGATRAEAMKRGASAYLVPLDSAGTDWSKGWRAFVDVNGNQVYDAGTDTLINETAALEFPSSVSVTNNSSYTGFLDSGARYVRFNGSGYPILKTGGFSGGALQLNNATQARAIVLNAVGRMRVCTPVTDTTCTATGF